MKSKVTHFLFEPRTLQAGHQCGSPGAPRHFVTTSVGGHDIIAKGHPNALIMKSQAFKCGF